MPIPLTFPLRGGLATDQGKEESSRTDDGTIASGQGIVWNFPQILVLGVGQQIMLTPLALRQQRKYCSFTPDSS